MNELVPRIGDERIDTLPVERAQVDDLNFDAVAQHVARAVADDRYDGGQIEPLAFLREMRCVVEHEDRLVPTLAGLLIFGYRPQAFLEHTDIALAHFAGTTPDLATAPLHFRRYGGTLTQQIVGEIARVERDAGLMLVDDPVVSHHASPWIQRKMPGQIRDAPCVIIDTWASSRCLLRSANSVEKESAIA